MNIFYITVLPSEVVVSRPINYCSLYEEFMGSISLRIKMVVIDFRVFPVAPIAASITFKSLSSFLLLHPPPPPHCIMLWPTLGQGLPITRTSRLLKFYYAELSSSCPIPNTRVSMSGLSLQIYPTWLPIPAARPSQA